MLWDEEKDYIKYQSSLYNLKNMLGIHKLDFIVRPEIAPYITRIVQHLEYKLTELGVESKMLDKITLVKKIYSDGADLIVTERALELANTIDGLKDVSDEDPVLYDQEKFIFSWTNIMTSLVTLINLQYSHLLYKPLSPDCPCECAKGENQNTWDGYFSGVWPENENIDYVIKDNEEVEQEKNNCTCSYRI